MVTNNIQQYPTFQRRTWHGRATILRHCPRCEVRRMHHRRVNGGMEVLTCSVCGQEQFYRAGKPA